MLRLYNSLGREEQDFEPIESRKVGIYTCGPTVYHYVTIGNWRTYTLGDLVVRSLRFLGYETDYIMNITDVGHLTGDNEGDADTGEDRLEKAAKKEGKTAWDIAEFYTDNFLEGYRKLNLTEPRLFTKATDHIDEQVALVNDLEKRGFAYAISDGIYFDTKAYEAAGYTYGEISNLDQIKEGARVEINEEKRDARDFALWKFSPKGEKRHMEWDSPWGIGFPGWHIECSAMSMKYLGNKFDIHIGGEDLRSTHHPNEIAQSEGATGETPFVKYWMHGAFLQVDGGKMGKSLGNAYKIEDIEEQGFDPLDLRYFYLGAQYRTKQNFTWEGMQAAKQAREKLSRTVLELKKSTGPGTLSEQFVEKFIQALEDDFNMPKALASVWELIKSDNPDEDKLETLLHFDQVFGLNLDDVTEIEEAYSDEVKNLIEERKQARERKDWNKADEIRDRLRDEFGVEVNDTKA